MSANLPAAAASDDALGECAEGPHDEPSALHAFEELIETSDCPMLIVDRTPQGQSLRYANATLKRLLGYGDGELVGREWSSLFTPDGLESALSLARSAMDLGLEVKETLRAEHVSGAVLWLDARLYPIRNPTGLVTQYVGILNDVTNERRSREELERRAYHDALTGLANRYLLWDRFEHARAHARRCGGSLALVVLDLNGFKLINDRFGHQAGDDLLRCVGARLSAAVRGEDTVARLGGDEFVLLLGDGPDGAAAASVIIERAAEALAQPIILQRQRLVLTCSAGVSRYPEDGSDLESLLKTADVALYRAKARAKGPEEKPTSAVE